MDTREELNQKVEDRIRDIREEEFFKIYDPAVAKVKELEKLGQEEGFLTDDEEESSETPAEAEAEGASEEKSGEEPGDNQPAEEQGEPVSAQVPSGY